MVQVRFDYNFAIWGFHRIWVWNMVKYLQKCLVKASSAGPVDTHESFGLPLGPRRKPFPQRGNNKEEKKKRRGNPAFCDDVVKMIVDGGALPAIMWLLPLLILALSLSMFAVSHHWCSIAIAVG
ncbi:hypothetical protein MRB53_026550 [Persea americana]|uniref:Uncharacterized protein n=1 Tax=Persea americana TaxID=3435 RepID=A0ACC2LIG5_PERAE|nr:hypothetical protein MRB53_026550 [Persea americana]